MGGALPIWPVISTKLFSTCIRSKCRTGQTSMTFCKVVHLQGHSHRNSFKSQPQQGPGKRNRKMIGLPPSPSQARGRMINVDSSTLDEGPDVELDEGRSVPSIQHIANTPRTVAQAVVQPTMRSTSDGGRARSQWARVRVVRDQNLRMTW